jgi:hypothetical protein
MEKKKYSISQLASILTISETAIRKKIKGDGETKRYKERYQVVGELQNNKIVDFVMLDDIELQSEIQISKRNKNKFTGQSNVYKTSENVLQNCENVVENVEYIDVTPQVQQIDDFSKNDYLEFTKRYFEKLDNLYYTLHETQRETLEKDKQIYMLEDFEKRTKKDIFELEANNKTLSTLNKRYKIGLITLLITFIIALSTLTVLLILAIKKPPEIRTVEVEKIIEKPVIKYVRR